MIGDKFELITTPTQSGKTFQMIQCMMDMTKNSSKRLIHIVFCDNNLNLTLQTKNRINIEFNTLMFSSNSKIRKIDELFTKIISDTTINVICCCTNSNKESCIERFFDLFKKINSTIEFSIWIDELHLRIESIQNYLYNWETFDNVIKITGITATPEKILKLFNDGIKIKQLKNPYNSEIYQSFKSSNIVIKEINNSKYSDIEDEEESIDNENNITKSEQINLDYISDIMDNEMTNLESCFLFVPGSTFKRTHYQIKDLLLNYNYYILIVNGDSKNGILYHKNEEIDVSTILDKQQKNLAFSEITKILFQKYNLENKKFAVTGYLRVTTGITISSDRCVLTHQIIPPTLKDKDSLYQCARILGNTKNFEKFVIPTIYCTSKIKKIIQDRENGAMILSTMEKENINLKDYRNCMKFSDESDIDYKIFDSFESMKTFASNLNSPESGKNIRLVNKFTDYYRNEDGLLPCIIRGKQKVYDLEEVKNNIRSGLGKKEKHRRYVCYEKGKELYVLAWVKSYYI
jgi:hypothetical protein